MSLRRRRPADPGPPSSPEPAAPPAAGRDGTTSALTLWIQPRADDDAVVGERDGIVAIRLQAAPVDGAANTALIRFLARRLGCSAASVRLLRGARGRRKWVAVEGLSADQLRGRLLQA